MLPELLKEFSDVYTNILDEQLAPVMASVKESQKRVFEVLDTKEYKEQKNHSYFTMFGEIAEAAKACTNVSILRSYADRAEALKIRLLNEMDKMDRDIAMRKAEEMRKALEAQAAQSGTVDKEQIEAEVKKEVKVKETKNVLLKSMTKTASWRIESKEDVDRYVEELRTRLMDELKADIIINIEF